MIDLYSWGTPNGHKIHIMFEETGLEYAVYPINIRAGDQFKEDFLAFSPNNRIPAMIDRDGAGGNEISVFESGAMLIYLADKSGQFMPSLASDPVGHYDVLQWLMFQMGGVGPMFGQVGHFRNYARERATDEELQYGIDRYTNEAHRLYGVLDRQLEKHDYLAGDYSIADMAVWPWCRAPERRGVDHADFPNVTRWFDAIDTRPAVKKAVQVLDAESQRPAVHDDKAWSIMFGDKQFEKK
ncbi:MAG: glutathione binding-like protein [Alphaproteobacteria bacterium]|jgi:GST-like protein